VTSLVAALLALPAIIPVLFGLGALASFRQQRGSRWWSSLLLCASAVCFVGGQIAGILGTNPLPSSVDGGYVPAGALILAAVFLFTVPVAQSVRARTLMDGLMTTAAAGAYLWYFILGPDVLDSGIHMNARIVVAIYATLDLGLVLALIVVASSIRSREIRLSGILIVALLLILGADSVRNYQAVHEIRAGFDGLLAVVRSLGFALAGLTAVLLLRHRTGKARDSDSVDLASRPPAWRYLLPYALMPAVVGLALYAARSDPPPVLENGLYVIGAVVFELIFLHQYLAFREITSFASRSTGLETLAGADPVTGLPNHRSLVLLLDQEIERANRYHRPFSLLFIDLDHFKMLNDTFGHLAGDAALREFNSVARTVLRNVDGLGRWGGEEFLVILPETHASAAMAVAERVRAAVAGHRFWATGAAQLSCSLGVATYPLNANSRNALIELADQAMYQAKRLGRNQVHFAHDSILAKDVGSEGGSSQPHRH
jgi:diguanylate cyclase (GGDEF)-like protein